MKNNFKSPIGVFPVSVSFNKKRNKWDKVPATSGKSWVDYQATESELEKANNLGAKIPTGVLVFDLDVGDDRQLDDLQSDIEKALNAEFEIDWPKALLQSTVSGGAHYAFKVDANIVISQQTDCKGVKGFDLRVANKGWICTGEGYKSGYSVHDTVVDGLYSNDLDTLPDTVMDILQTRAKVINDDDALLLAVTNKTLGLTDAEIDSYMERLPVSLADEGDSWLSIGMGLYHETLGSDFGWDLFDKFSQQCEEKYDERQNRARWNSFGTNTGSKKITFASIIKLANDHEGATHIVESEKVVENLLSKLDSVNNFVELKEYCLEVGSCKLDSVDLHRIANVIKSREMQVAGSKLLMADIKKMMKPPVIKNMATGAFVDDYVYLKSAAKYMNRYNKKSMNHMAFDVVHTRETPDATDDAPQLASIFARDKIQFVEGVMYAPMFGDVFNYDDADYLNGYKPNNLLPIIPIKGAGSIVNRMKNHIKHLLPKQEEQDIVINYLAHNVQKPGVKLQWAIVLQGVQGDGKTILSEMMQLVMGMSNVRLLNVKTLESNFTAWTAGQCMTFIEELKLDNFRKYEILNNLKPYISNEVIEVTAKGKDPLVALNTTNYFALTNFKDALPIDDKDRRYCVLFSQWQCAKKLAEFERDNKGYYSNLYDDMRNNAGELLHWLSNHKIPQSFIDAKRAPVTLAKKSMSALAKSDGFILVDDAIGEFESEMINENVVNLTELNNKARCTFTQGYENFPSPGVVKNILMDLGYHNIGTYKNKERKTQVIYCKDDNKKALDFKNLLNNDLAMDENF